MSDSKKRIEVAEQWDYKAVEYETPSPNDYRYSKLYPQNASQNVTLTPGATSPVTIELPADVYNLSRAYLQYSIAPTATAGVVNITWKDLMSHITEIQLVSRNQILIADLQNVSLYTKAVWKPEIKFEDYKTFETFGQGALTNAAVAAYVSKNPYGYGCMLTRCGAISETRMASTTIIGANAVNANTVAYPTDKLSTYRVYPCFSPNSGAAGNPVLKITLSSNISTPTAAAATPTDQTPSNSIPYDEPQYFEIGIAQNDTTPTYNIRFPLSLLLNTIFSVDKDLYFNGEITYLKIFFSPSTAIFYTANLNLADLGTTIGQPTTGNDTIGGNACLAAPCSNLVVANATNQGPAYAIAPVAGNANITNLTLWLPINRDPLVKERLKSFIDREGGMRIPIPFIWTMNQSFTVPNTANVTPAPIAQNVTLKLNSSHGKRLLKIYYTLLNADYSSITTPPAPPAPALYGLYNLQYDISNLGYLSIGGQNVGVGALTNGYKIQSFQTFLDSKPLQDYIINCTTGDHYQLQLPYLKGSIIQNSNMYDYNFCWIERFDNLLAPANKPYREPYNNLLDGLDLSVERKYDFISICNQYFALTHYAFVVTQRDLIISNQGIFLDRP